jgi:hypothetical protein
MNAVILAIVMASMDVSLVQTLFGGVRPPNGNSIRLAIRIRTVAERKLSAETTSVVTIDSKDKCQLPHESSSGDKRKRNGGRGSAGFGNGSKFSKSQKNEFYFVLSDDTEGGNSEGQEDQAEKQEDA